MNIEGQCVVSIHYKLTDDAGAELDSSEGRDPLTYLHASNNLIPGLESALEGKTEGDQLQVDVEPEQAYGPVNEELIQTVPHTAFEGAGKVEPGMRFQARGPQGQTQQIVVREVGDEGVTVDANHPLAGQTLHFDVTVVEVREATEEEKQHGHVHGPGQAHEH